jgi:rfaE bifunctional protein nucleotidyltransferase chain/domain
MPKDKIVDPEYVRLLSEELRRNNSVLVFTNGIFDLLHPGHVHYLNEARKLGTHLMVALNSDASARRIKGDRRPLNSLDERVEVLAALEAVSFVTWFEEDTPAEIIRSVHPNVLVKGSDWETEKIVGKNLVESYGGKVLTIPYLSGYSTSALIEKILKTN